MRDHAERMSRPGRRRAEAARDKARKTVLRRKEQYLGARVSLELREKVLARAERLGIPVSILIRNVLEEAFADTAPGEGATVPMPSGRGGRFPGVIGWEDILLNRAMSCSACGQRIEGGSRVTLGLSVPGEDHVILCGQCKGPD